VTPKQLRDFLTYYIDESGKWTYTLTEHGFIKPDRFGTGSTMTIGIIPINVSSWCEIADYVSNAMNSFEEIKESIKEREDE